LALRTTAAIALIVLLGSTPAQAQTIPAEPVGARHSPRGALWRAAAVPGWGQFYNRQYYKVPIVWGGLAGLTASALYVNHRYLLYRHAYHYVSGTNTTPRYEADYRRLLNELGIPEERGPQLEGAFRQSRDNLRRNRDLLYIGIGLFYGLSILDAYVNAHLLDFDVGEDLTLGIGATPAGVTATLHLRP